MKKVVMGLMFLLTLSLMAQRPHEQEGRRMAKEKMTAEQVATLQTKKLTLALDLTEDQQKKVKQINLANAEFHESKMAERDAKNEEHDAKKPSTEERFNMQNERLERQLAEQKQMKQILTDEQYAQWRKLKMKRHERGKRKKKGEGRRG
ncbi:MAG: hypothetical protein HKP24_04595 [Croceitalea sp.]|nr:hypothetical protein [Croceitalea sp.]NNC35262.1 hypothetical protein [Croceitalea sp.]NNM17829.1 hypothetical protein [Croceitalea sp.]